MSIENKPALALATDAVDYARSAKYSVLSGEVKRQVALAFIAQWLSAQHEATPKIAARAVAAIDAINAIGDL